MIKGKYIIPNKKIFSEKKIRFNYLRNDKRKILF